MFSAVTDPNSPLAVRYVRDHLEKDTFVAPNKTMKLRGGDCDDQTSYLGALLRSVGYPVKLRIVQARSASTWSHIYLLVGLPPTEPTKWVPLDATMAQKGPGWEAPDSMVSRRKDFEV
jgi:transglutaminase-like putative cysteine protease